MSFPIDYDSMCVADSCATLHEGASTKSLPNVIASENNFLLIQIFQEINDKK